MDEAVELIRSRTDMQPEVAIVLGSGLGHFADSLSNAVRLPYGEIPGLPVSTAVGHKGDLLIGALEGRPVAVMSGRFHLYEGYSAREVTSGIRLLHALGCRTVVLTNAAGGINLAYASGALVLIADHINLQGANPLVGLNDASLGPRFPDMTEAYSPRLRSIALKTAAALEIKVHEGVYAGLLGPSYETPAEIRYLKTIGADLVGMSTVSETISANHMGMEVLGISCVTNVAAGLSGQKLDHDEVLAVGERVVGTLIQLLQAVIPKL